MNDKEIEEFVRDRDKAEGEEADPMFIDELKQPIPNAIIIWLKTGEKIVFIDKE